MVVSLAAIALALDAVDGWVARRTRATSLGARFDGEVDAFLILVLSIYVAPEAGAWVLAIGAARYAFLAAGWALPWLRAPLPPRYWRKVVAATQGIVLTIAAADVLPPTVTEAALVVALVLLAEAFGRDVWWLRRHRHATDTRAGASADSTVALGAATPRGDGGERREWIAAALTVLAFLLVWAVLVAPDHPLDLTATAFLRLPLEGLILIAAVSVVPAPARRLLAGVVGPLLALVAILKLLDIGFFATFNRPFDPYQDLGYAGIGGETLSKLIGAPSANLVIAGTVVLTAALFALMTVAVFRLTRVAADNRRWSLRAVAALGVAWALCWAFGAHLASDTRFASTSAASVVVDK